MPGRARPPATPPATPPAMGEESLRRDLGRAIEELDQLAYVVSHDLRQPLRAIGSYVVLLEQELEGRLSGDAARFIGFVEDGVRRMDALIVDLLAYSRIGRSGETGRVDCGAALTAALAALAPDIAAAGAKVTLATPMPEIRGDESEVERLFAELVGNALKYRSPERPLVIVISCADTGGDWEFRVADNGVGIPSEHAERVFGIFQRLHARHEFPGTGIGLALCRKIVIGHGGTIAVDPPSGPGCVLRFTLPKG